MPKLRQNNCHGLGRRHTVCISMSVSIEWKVEKHSGAYGLSYCWCCGCCFCFWRFLRQTLEIQTKGLHFSPCERKEIDGTNHMHSDNMKDSDKTAFIRWPGSVYTIRLLFWEFHWICVFVFVVAYFAILFPMIQISMQCNLNIKNSFETNTHTQPIWYCLCSKTMQIESDGKKAVGMVVTEMCRSLCLIFMYSSGYARTHSHTHSLTHTYRGQIITKPYSHYIYKQHIQWSHITLRYLWLQGSNHAHTTVSRVNAKTR